MAVWKRAVVLGERKAVARCRFQPDRCQAAFRGTDPLPPKAVTGSLRSHRRSVWLLKRRAVHAGVELDCESDHLEPFFVSIGTLRAAMNLLTPDTPSILNAVGVQSEDAQDTYGFRSLDRFNRKQMSTRSA